MKNLQVKYQFEGMKYPNTFEPVTIKFSGGELHVKLPEFSGFPNMSSGLVRINARIQSSDDLIELVMLMDILRRVAPNAKFGLFMPYVPYARQDRVTKFDTAFTLKPFAAIINSLDFQFVKSYDCHSDVAPALINNLDNEPVEYVIGHHATSVLTTHRKVDALISPDAGAVKKVSKVAELFKKPMIVCTKSRNVETGELLPPTVCADRVPEQVLIVDDICDGGGTFIALAMALRAKGAKHISLYVTHGIFSKGLEVFNGLIDMFYTTDSFTSPMISAPPANLIVDKVFE